MSSIAIAGDTSGSVVLAAPAVAGSNTITLAAQTGTLNVAGPAFSAYLGTNQTPTAAVLTKIQFNTEEFDTNNNYDNATNYRFTPTVSGYYQVNAFVLSSGGGGVYISLYKNGAEFKRGNGTFLPTGALGANTGYGVSALISCNGSTDYIEIYGYNSAGGVFTAGAANTYFQASLVRGA